MQLRECVTVIVIVGIALVGIGVVIPKLFSGKDAKKEQTSTQKSLESQILKEDNILEEMGEGILEKTFGLEEGSLDFTPDSKENSSKKKKGKKKE